MIVPTIKFLFNNQYFIQKGTIVVNMIASLKLCMMIYINTSGKVPPFQPLIKKNNMPKKVNYLLYKPEDFILDEDFLQWHHSNNKELKKSWEKWLDAHPEMKPVINEARDTILQLKPREIYMNQETIDEQFSSIAKHFDKKTTDKTQQ